MAPLVADDPSIDKPLLVLAVGCGSLFLSHVNDAGFWLVNQYFGMSVKDTLKTWSVMETLIPTVGFAFVLLRAVSSERDQVVLGVDIGTTATKVVAFDTGGGVRGDAPPATRWTSRTRATPSRTRRRSSRPWSRPSARPQAAAAGGARVAGLAFSSAMHSLLGLDADGRPVTPSITWADTRAAPQAERLRAAPRARAAPPHRHAGAPDVAAAQAGLVPRAGAGDASRRGRALGRHQGARPAAA